MDGLAFGGRHTGHLRLTADEPGQFVEIADYIGYRGRFAQHPIAVAQPKLRFFPGVSLVFFDDEQRCFMRVSENREQRGAIHVIKRVIAPFAGGDTRAVG